MSEEKEDISPEKVEAYYYQLIALMRAAHIPLEKEVSIALFQAALNGMVHFGVSESLIIEWTEGWFEIRREYEKKAEEIHKINEEKAEKGVTDFMSEVLNKINEP